jgi:hypothetical protein
MPAALLTVAGTGGVTKAAGDTVRKSMDFGNVPLLQQGYTIVSYNVTCSDVGAPTISSKSLDNAYTVSALFTGGTAGGSYGIVFSITLNDLDSTVVTRTGIMQVI